MLFGLAALFWVLVLRFSAAYMHTCCYRINYHKHKRIGGTYIHIFNHIDHVTGKDWMDLSFLTLSVRKNRDGLKLYELVATVQGPKSNENHRVLGPISGWNCH
jgi:hypothetical protein